VVVSEEPVAIGAAISVEPDAKVVVREESVGLFEPPVDVTLIQCFLFKGVTVEDGPPVWRRPKSNPSM
jgi:hypothetical protein